MNPGDLVTVVQLLPDGAIWKQKGKLEFYNTYGLMVFATKELSIFYPWVNVYRIEIEHPEVWPTKG